MLFEIIINQTVTQCYESAIRHLIHQKLVSTIALLPLNQLQEVMVKEQPIAAAFIWHLLIHLILIIGTQPV